MEAFKDVVNWYTQRKNYVDFAKDIIFAIGVVATFYGYIRFIKFLAQRKILNKRQEMENDAKLYSEIHDKLKEHVDSYGASKKKMRDIGIRLLFIKNYPYKLDADGYSHMLYYYFLSENHQATGYISGKGIYVMDYIWFWGNSIYYNPKNEKWFMADKGLSFKKYMELNHKQLVKRIPFTNIYGYDFNSDWANKGEPVFYIKHKYYKWKLFADELEAVDVDQEYHLANKVPLKKSKRTKKIRTRLFWLQRKMRIYFMNKKRPKKRKPKS